MSTTEEYTDFSKVSDGDLIQVRLDNGEENGRTVVGRAQVGRGNSKLNPQVKITTKDGEDYHAGTHFKSFSAPKQKAS